MGKKIFVPCLDVIMTSLNLLTRDQLVLSCALLTEQDD